jgi:hypothetical protein
VIHEEPPDAVRAGSLGPVIARLLDRDPEQRPTAEQARHDLEWVRDGAVPDLPPIVLPSSDQEVQPVATNFLITEEEGGAAGAEPSPEPAPPARRGRAVVALGGIAAAAVAVALAVHGLTSGAAPRVTGSAAGGTVAASTSGTTTGEPSRAATSAASSSPTSASTPTMSGTSAGASEPGAAVPAGFRLYQDPTGFAVAVPQGWSRSVQGTDTYFRQPDGSGYLQVDQTSQPKPDTLQDWRQQASTAASRFPGYHLVRLDRVAYRGWDAADWEFTWTSGGSTVHVLNRNIRPSDRHAYALYWSVPDGEWDARQQDFSVIAASFQPTS